MPQCFVKNCGNYYGKTRGNAKIIYHMIPCDATLAQKWADLCGNLQNKIPSYGRVCSEHFSEKCYQRDLQHELLGLPLRKKLKPDALPDQNLPKKRKTSIFSHEKLNKTDEPITDGENAKTKRRKLSFDQYNVEKILKEKEKGQISKINNRLNRLPMRSSIRIAKKKSIESLSDSFTEKINSKVGGKVKFGKPERFSDKLKFMAKLQLKYEKNETFVKLPKYDLEKALEKIMKSKFSQDVSLNKMQIMEDVREGCDVQPSSPGHAEQRNGNGVKEEPIENGFETEEVTEERGDVVVKVENKDEKKSDSENEEKNEENYSSASSLSESTSKRKSSEIEETPVKRLKSEIQENFLTRDRILSEFVEMAGCDSLERIQTFSEQVLAEIKTLNELAKEKEREWNNIIHLKKIKEELLIRMQRKRQVMLLSDSELLSESPNNGESGTHPQSLLKSNQKPRHTNSNGTEKITAKNLLMLNQTNQQPDSYDFRQGRQRPVLDVQSIIADYRQRHPEAVPRRGRRIRHPTSTDTKNATKQGMDSELGMLLNSLNGNPRETTQDSPQSFKDMLVQFAKLSQNERHELIQNAMKPPPPYPEVTVHPVPATTATPTNSLLHGILTKNPTKQTNNSSKTSFSPTLARLLTAPERTVNNQVTSTPTTTMHVHPNNMSISEILSTSKARNEITITPVGNQFETTPTKGESTAEDESEEGTDRLVIDEASETRKDDTGSDGGDDVPQCQGCNQKTAQFVCAGCGNQWYCSRDCQVSAWDEHSEVCSG